MFCECGCGLPTRIARDNDPRRGYVKGRPIRFIHGHHMLGVRRPRLSKTKDYRGAGATRLHRERAERALGKPLPAGAVVHHADGSRNDDAPLVICQDTAYHFLLHARMRVKAAGGDPNTERICGRCRNLKPLSSFTPQMATCRSCRNAHFRETHGVGGPQKSKRKPQ